MKNTICALIICLSIGSIANVGLCESDPNVPRAAAKSAMEAGVVSVPAISTDKAGARPNTESEAAARVTEKLWNAVSSEYIIGAEDVLDVTVWRNPDLSKQVQVRPDGRISMPIIRDITAVGKTPTQLAEEMMMKLKEYVQNPVVSVTLKEVNSSNIFVLGEIARPGRYPLKSKTTLLQGITIAGGFTPIAARNQIVIFRFTDNAPGMKRLTASYDDIVLRGGIAENFELKSGDTVVVPSESMVVFPGREGTTERKD